MDALGGDWLVGLQKLMQGTQNPDAFAQKAAAAGVDPNQISQLLSQSLGVQLNPAGGQATMNPSAAAVGGAERPGLTSSIPTDSMGPSLDEILYGNLPQQGPYIGSKEAPMGTMPEIVTTAPNPPGQPPVTAAEAATAPTPQAAPATAKAEAAKKPGLTAEQMAKIASLIPKGQAVAPANPGGAMPTRTVQMAPAQVAQASRRTLADILGRR